MSEKLSIIIPIYNMEKYLERCLDSILKQSLENVKVICVNDGSTDASKEILNNYLVKFPNVIQIINITNQGRAVARNSGLKEVYEGLVWFVDPDDYLTEDSIKKVRRQMDKDTDILVFNWINQFETSVEFSKFGTSIESAGSGSANKIFRRELIGDLTYPDGFWYEDLGFIPILLGIAKKIKGIEDYLYVYDRTRQDSQSNSVDLNKITDTVPMCEMVYKKLILEQNKQNLYEEVGKLFYKHLVVNTVLKNVSKLYTRRDRSTLVTIISKELNFRYPQWGKIQLEEFKGVKGILKKKIISLYFHEHYGSGIALWHLFTLIKSLKKRVTFSNRVERRNYVK